MREGARGGSERREGGSDDDRQGERASVEEGRVEEGRVAEGNEGGKDRPRHGRREGQRRGKGASERADEGLREEGREQGAPYDRIVTTSLIHWPSYERHTLFIVLLGLRIFLNIIFYNCI